MWSFKIISSRIFNYFKSGCILNHKSLGRAVVMKRSKKNESIKIEILFTSKNERLIIETEKALVDFAEHIEFAPGHGHKGNKSFLGYGLIRLE